MQLKYWLTSLLLTSICFTLIQCNGASKQESSDKDEAMRIYNESMAVAEDMTARLSSTTNNLKILDNSIRNVDTAAVIVTAQAYDDIATVKQLITQWKRDVPRVSSDPTVQSSLAPAELLAKQKEFKEKIEYIRFRLDDLDKLLKDTQQSVLQ